MRPCWALTAPATPNWNAIAIAATRASPRTAVRGPSQRRRVRRETHGETGMIALLRGRIGRGTAEWFRCAMMDAISQTVRGSCGEVVSLLGGVVDVRSVVNCGLSGVG